jgi:CheY-like chemotaxis protein
VKTPNNDPPDASRRVVVADDNRDAAASLALMLTLEGYEVHTAYDGRQALNLVRAFEPGTVFLDIHMPELDGCTVARVIRAEQAERPPVRLATVSAYDCSVECQAYARSCHVERHFGKPCDSEKVLAFLKEAAARE